MGQKYELSKTREMRKRRAQATEFFDAAFDREERPYFVSDEATLYDIYLGDEQALIERCESHYGVTLRVDQFASRVWELLDYLALHRRR